ncbi:MAG: ATP-binding protein, partial [Anaerotignum sp.]|nr:ATP-binding protein [Anaerotignum sp.]
MQEKGNLSINSENFLPIIKKWLYTDKDIFIRELVSNACDAVTKLQKLNMMGEADIPTDEKYEIHVVLDQDNKTLQIIDNGIGMTADEIKKYINQIAFSGATDFLAKFQEKGEGENEIIGHFGLGFYSAFMVADKVEIDTLSYQNGAAAAKWICEGGIDYEMEAGARETRGTTITLYIGADGEEFLNEATLYEAMTKYCSFMPVPIFVDVQKEETEEEKAAARKAAQHVSMEEAMEMMQKENTTEETAEETEEEPVPMNDTNPLWQRKPSECTDEDYKAFYHKVFNDINDPLFWIHLNMDYPFRLKGILDCPDMPLNVSRSALQNDGYVEKMNAYITKKVADKLNQLFKNDRPAFEGFWDDINIFIKYGCMREEKLYDKVKDALLLKTTDGVYETVAEYLEKNK